ncbi:pentapeptide repeat-containing protein [Planotetraspora sp. A-T 1434]|nr:pentapeptide repeat-containing protein [Planotetraspora sp. A-T 1434]
MPCGTRLRLVNALMSGLDMSNLPMEGADLRGARLEHANLQRIVLRKADLRGAYLTGSECQEAVFEEANMEGIHLEDAGLMWARMERARLAHAHLERASLPEAHLEGADLLEAHLADAYMGAVYLSGANLLGADLRRSRLLWGRLDGTRLVGTNIAGGALWRAQMRGANLAGADLEGADLTEAHLEGADLAEARLRGANLTRVYLDSTTNLESISAGGENGGITVADAYWNNVNLAAFDWSVIKVLGDEDRAREADRGEGPMTPPVAYSTAARASRQVAQELRARGMDDEAHRFAYRAQVLQRLSFRRQGLSKLPSYLFSSMLAVLAGYGYRPGRSFVAYALVVTVFMLVYHSLGPGLTLLESMVISVTAFHGRGFFPGTFSPGDPLALVAAAQAIIGLVIELVLLATVSQRLFGK